MRMEIFIIFNGNCRQAVEFYAKIFKSEIGELMTYGDSPEIPGYTALEADKERIMYAGLPIGGMVVMFSDCSSQDNFVAGNNICPTISTDDKDEVTRLYNELGEGGEILMPLAQTFFSELYGAVKDKFGVIWQVAHYNQPA